MANLNIAIEIAAKDAASSVIGGITSAVGNMGAVALGVAGAGIAGLGAGLALAVSEAMGAQEVMAQTEAVITSTGGAAGMTAAAVADLATELSHSSRFAGDAIQEGENLLLTFTNIGGDVFPMATQAMVDMATAMGTDVSSGAIQLGKALNDPVAGISALSRVGVTFTDDQKKVIESMVEAGDVAGAQQVILAELNKEFGGSAAAAAQTFAGRMDVMKNRLLDVAEAIGGPLLTIGMDLMDRFLTPAIPVIEGMGEALTWFIGAVSKDGMTAALAGLKDFSWEDMLGETAGGLMNQFIGGLQTLNTAAGDVWNTLSTIDFGPLMTAFGDLFATIGADMPSSQSIVTSVADGIKIAAQGLADFMNNILLPAITAVVTWFKDNWPAIKATGEEVMNGLQTAIQTVADAISAFWSEWGDDIRNAFDERVQAVQQIFDLFGLAFEGKWYEFGQKLREGWDETWLKVQETVQSGIDWFGKQDWGAIGTSIIQGIAGGISSATQFIVDAATSAARAAYDAAKGFLGIQSPSKKFWELGEYSAMGFVGGMDSMQPAMASASADAAYSAYGGAAAVTSSGYGGGIVLNIDARGASDPGGIRAAIEEGVRRGLEAAGVRADRIRRTG